MRNANKIIIYDQALKEISIFGKLDRSLRIKAKINFG